MSGLKSWPCNMGLCSEHCSGPSRSENSKFWTNRKFRHFARIGCIGVLACAQFCLECAHACASWPCVSLCRSDSVSLCVGQLSARWEALQTEVPEGTKSRIQISLGSMKQMFPQICHSIYRWKCPSLRDCIFRKIIDLIGFWFSTVQSLRRGPKERWWMVPSWEMTGYGFASWEFQELQCKGPNA